MIENKQVFTWIKENDMANFKAHIHEIDFYAHEENMLIQHPLMAACYLARYNIFKLMVDNGADLFYQVGHFNLMKMAISSNKPSKNIIKYLCKHTNLANTSFGVEGNYPLLFSIEKKHYDIAQLLLNYTDDINVFNQKTGYDAMMLSLEKENFDLALKILKKHPDLNQINHYDESAFHLLVKSKKLDIHTFNQFLPHFTQSQIFKYDENSKNKFNALDVAYHFGASDEICLKLIYLGLTFCHVITDAKDAKFLEAIENTQLKFRLEHDLTEKTKKEKIKI